MAASDTALACLRSNGGADLLPAEQINQLARQSGLAFRDRELTPGRTLQLFVQQIAAGNIACAAVRHLAHAEFTDSAWCQARARLPLELVRQAHQTLVAYARRELDQSDNVGSEGYRWRGHRLYILDGSSDSMPDTPELRAHYGVPSGCREGLGFPMSHLLLLMDHRSGLFLDCLDDPRTTSDLAKTPALHAQLEPGDVLLGDDFFAGYAHLALLSQAGVHAVVPAHHLRIVDFTPGRAHAHPRRGKSTRRTGKPRSRVLEALGPDDQLVEYLKPPQKPAWLSPEQWAGLPDTITVREVRRTVRRRGFRPIVVTIVTTLLDPQAYPADELIELRLTRWLIETNIRHLKTTLGMDVLKCKTVAGVRKERLVFLLVYNLIRLLMLRAARRQGTTAQRLSFADTLAWLRYGDLSAQPELLVNPLRPGRLEPRVLKRPKKQFPYMTKPRAVLKQELRAKYGEYLLT
jgi:hypothetical protein